MNSSPTTTQTLATAMTRQFVELRSAQQERQQRIQALLCSPPTSAAFISAATRRQTDYSNPSNTSTTTTTSDLTDGSTAEPTVRSEITIPPTFSPTDCVLRSVNPLFIYDTTTNLSTTTNYFKLDMHEHQQQPTTSHSQNYQPSFVPLIRKYESFNTTVEPPRGLCATPDLHCNDCGRPKTSFYEPPTIFINILPQNDLHVCKILSLPFTGSAADHVQEL